MVANKIAGMVDIDLNSTVILLISMTRWMNSRKKMVFKFHCDSINIADCVLDIFQEVHLNSTVILLIWKSGYYRPADNKHLNSTVILLIWTGYTIHPIKWWNLNSTVILLIYKCNEWLDKADLNLNSTVILLI